MEADYYSLGVTICFVAAGAIPVFLADLPTARPLWDRLADWLAIRAQTVNLSADLQALILGLMDDEPQRRVTASAARRALAADNPDLTHGTAGLGLTFLH